MIMLDPHDHQLLQGFLRLSMALRLRDSSMARADDLSSFQAQAVLMLSQAIEPMRLGDLASGLAVTAAKAATASDAVSALVRKGYVSKQPAPNDARSRLLARTGKGSALADKVISWPNFLSNALVDLDATERAIMCRALVKMIRRLQEAGDVPSGKLCVDCVGFRPHASNLLLIGAFTTDAFADEIHDHEGDAPPDFDILSVSGQQHGDFSVFAYVWPLSADPSVVGFPQGAGRDFSPGF